jgi:hypothetical protein
MALDTRDKRFSAMGMALPFVQVLPDPNDDIDAEDRAQALFLYRMTLSTVVSVIYTGLVRAVFTTKSVIGSVIGKDVSGTITGDV